MAEKKTNTGLRPIRLPGLAIECPVALGPMAGVTDGAFRELTAEMGCGLFYTEMVSAKALHYRNANTKLLLTHGDKDRPIGVQLFGRDPEILAEEAGKLEESFDFIDFNMGCPVPKVVKNGEGSALLREPKLVEEIFTAMTKRLKKPVTVKLRKGFEADGEESLEIAKILEASGVSMIAVHARTRSQYYSGRADWEAIRRLKETVRIPVIGNGDIFSASDAVRMIEETGCDGVMVARGAEGNPWIFREIRTFLETGELPGRPDYEEIRRTVIRHGELLRKEKGEHLALLEMRRHAAAYLKGTPFSAEKRVRINGALSLEALYEIL